VQKSGDVVDSVNNLAEIVQEGVGVTRPTGQQATTPRGGYAGPGQPGSGSPDLVVGLAAGVAMVAEAVRAARKRARKKRERGGND
jgi:hypothetical protein